MIELLTAVQTQFNNSSGLSGEYGVFPDGCYLVLAPENVALPVCVLSVVSAVPQFNTGTYSLNVVTLQFSVYATDDTTALTAIKDIKAAFDFARLPLATEQSVLCQRTNELLTRDDEQTWHAMVEYQVWVGENNGGD